MQDMGELLDSMEPLKPLRRGDIVEGVVMRVDSEGILVNIGHKAEGIVPTREMRTLDQAEFDSLVVGDEVVTFVIRPESAEQSAILSIDRALGETGWRDLEKSLEAGETVKGKIIGFNRGGAIVEVFKVQGFVPMSQLVSVSRDIFRDTPTETKAEPPAETVETPAETQEAEPAASEESEESTAESTEPVAETPEPEVDLAEQSIGKDLQLKILEVNRSRNRAIFSERQAVQEWRDAQKARLDKLWQELRYVSLDPLRLVDVLDSLLETTVDGPQEGVFDSLIKPFNERAEAFRKTLVQTEAKHLDALVAFTGPPMMTDESIALHVLNGVLTGLGGRLFVELRDKRSLGYMTGSAFNPLFERSIFFGYANPSPDGIEEAVRVILDELNKVATEPVSGEEIDRSREWLVGSRVMQLQRNSAQATAYGSYEALGFGYEAVDNAPERIRNVTREAMMAVAAEVFRPENAVIVKMLPRE
ncbi:MAG: S1 RNA-binding domain-containing protein [Candidatus Krumholzibacteriota bacterium]|nr:S1 RNA-binding domain-containing protein [Candidatus Krumholzibacteriota bacterium]